METRLSREEIIIALHAIEQTLTARVVIIRDIVDETGIFIGRISRDYFNARIEG